MGISDGESNRHGGVEHRYWVERLEEQLRSNGYEVSQEVTVGCGKTIDLVATRDGKRTAFEIETGKSDAEANIRKCLAAGMERVVVVATRRSVRDSITRGLSNDPRVLCLTAAEVVDRYAGKEAGDK